MQEVDIPKPLPDPVEKDEEANFDGFAVDPDLVRIQVSGDYSGHGSDKIAGNTPKVNQINPSYRHGGWHVTVSLTDMPVTHDDYADVPVADVDAWIYTSEDRRKLEDSLNYLKEAKSNLSDNPMWRFEDDIDRCIEKVENHLRHTEHKLVEANGT